MNSSGIKSGLAAFAVSALAVSGLATFAGTAHAQSIDSNHGATGVLLLTQTHVGGSIANDGKNSTVTLLAAGGTDVKQVRFAYSVGTGTPQVIATVERAHGAFTTQWAPPVNVLGASVSLTVTGLSATGAEIAGAADTRMFSVTGAAKAVAIDAEAGTEMGAYQVPGTNNSVVGFTGTTNADAIAGATLSAPNANGIRTFSQVQTLLGYAWETGATAKNEAVLHATTADSDDAVPVKLYSQKVSGISAAPVSDKVQTGKTTSVVVTVTDQKGAPIAGASVENEAGDEAITNGVGQAAFAAVEASPATQFFHVNVTETSGYDSSVDFRKGVNITAYAPTVSALKVTSQQSAFDLDESIAAELKLAVTDQHGQSFAGAGNLKAQWIQTTFATPGETIAKSVQSIAGDVVPVPVGGFAAGSWELKVWQEKNGTPGQQEGDLAASATTLNIGQAKIVWGAGHNIAQVALGTEALLGGKIVLAENPEVALAGRTAVLDLASDATGDNAKASFVAEAAQPAGVKIAGTQATVKTAADGSFSVKVTDPAASLAGVTPTVTAKREVVTITPSVTFIAGADALSVQFQKVDVATIDLDEAPLVVGNDPTPGRPVVITGTVHNADRELLVNTPVEVTLDKGFFIAVPQKGGPQGALVGSGYTNLGTTRSVTTKADGTFTVHVAIERDVDFDDDFHALVKVSAKAGGVSDVEDIDFLSEDALNLKSLEISHAEDQGHYGSTVLPKASTDREVYFDVKALDQFGNRTATRVEVASTGVGAAHANRASANPEGSYAFVASGNRAGDQRLTVKALNQVKTTWTNTQTVPAADPIWQIDPVGFVPEADALTSAPLTTNWYDVDFAASSYTLTNNGGEQNPVGKIIRSTFEAKDQAGDALRGVGVEFFRSGPGNLATEDAFDGGAQSSTGVNGKTSATFQGTTAGTAVVSTLAEDWDGDLIAGGELSTKIVFGAPPTPTPTPDSKVKVNVKLKGANNGQKADKLKVVTSPAAKGVRVVLRAKNAQGKWVKVGTKTLRNNGKVKFTVRDRNGKAFTAYKVNVRKTATTTGAKAIKRIR